MEVGEEGTGAAIGGTVSVGRSPVAYLIQCVTSPAPAPIPAPPKKTSDIEKSISDTRLFGRSPSSETYGV